MIAVLAGARQRAGVTVVGLDGEVVVSVVTDRAPAGLAEQIAASPTPRMPCGDDGVTLSCLPHGAGVWLDATWKRAEARHD